VCENDHSPQSDAEFNYRVDLGTPPPFHPCLYAVDLGTPPPFHPCLYAVDLVTPPNLT